MTKSRFIKEVIQGPTFFCTEEILKAYFNTGAYHRGHGYFKQGRVRRCLVQEEQDYLVVTGIVHGKENYEVVCDVTEAGQILNTECDCFVGRNCKHAVAILLQAMSHQAMKEMIGKLPPKIAKPKMLVSVRPTLQSDEADWYSEISEKSDNQWFDLELGITLDGQKINLLQPLLETIRSMPQYFSRKSIADLPDTKSISIVLEDGRRLLLPIRRIKPILTVLTDLFDPTLELDEGKLQLSILRSAQLADLMAAASEAAKFRWLGGERLRALGEKLQQFKGIEVVSPPQGLKAELRPYQQDGLNWLQFLREYDLAGILADDMGLGKTVQALAHILVEKESGRMTHPTLVIAPTSLMFNWRMEAEKFTPSLRVLTLHGTLRKENFEHIHHYDLILTTYPLIVRDEAFLKAQDFHLLILDEAQIIKNPKAKATQIVQLLKAKHRLCLSGTPMENHLGELWSLFHFLLPALLGDHDQFKRLFRTPIEKKQDAERRTSLAQRIAPFLLRRRKSDVVKELPGKVEIVRTIEIESAQRDLYESIRLAMNEKVSQAINSKGLNKSHIIILDALLKLRQICCDPRLLKMDLLHKKKVNSAKLDFLINLLPTLIEEGRQILLFSQFTEMLALIEEALKEKNIAYVKLTGQTKDRQTPIQQFQKGEVKLFLISLKAGGVGLNLTAADVVIHYDPWWNPAVEQQATDRAHRIGQTKTVFVYKLITQGTVEEKIIAMQERKQALLDGLFDEETTEKNKLSAEDLRGLFN
jgi:SNF2 family DNA or RNA helicase